MSFHIHKYIPYFPWIHNCGHAILNSRGYEDNGINAWIKWIPKLDMKNSALQIQHWRPWGKKAYRHVMEQNYDFSGYLYKNRGDADYPAYSYLVGNLTFSENVMINKD